MHHAPALGHLALISLEIKVEMAERVVLDGTGLVAELVEFGEFRFRRFALDDETALDVLQRFLQLHVGKRVSDVGFEGVAGIFHWRLLSASGAGRQWRGARACPPAPRPRAAPRCLRARGQACPPYARGSRSRPR